VTRGACHTAIAFGLVLAWTARAVAQSTTTTTVLAPGEKVIGLPDGPVVIQHPPRPPDPFRLGLAYTHILSESGELADPHETANALGLEFSFRGGRVVREHVGIAHRWERSGAVSRKGFRLDLIALGFPIPVVERQVKLHVEPVLRLIRGDLMFVSVGGGPSQVLFRIESGVGLQITAAIDRWFFALEPVAVDFRYFLGTSDQGRGGFATLWSLSLIAGREF
jgi:hypothetical protein